MLASSSLLSLCLPSGHANTIRIFLGSGWLCWRRPPLKAFIFRQVTPTRDNFSRLAGGFVGVVLPAKPLSSVETRQHDPDFPDLQAALLAPSSPQSLCLPSGHVNTARFFPASGRQCWLRPPRKAFIFRQATPTWDNFYRLAGASVGVGLPAKPLSSVGTRQHDPIIPIDRLH